MIEESRLQQILADVAGKMDIRYRNPSFRYAPIYHGECRFSSNRNGNEDLVNPIFKIPQHISEQELAITGYFAHELGHIKLLNSKSHRLYLWMRQKPEVSNQFIILPSFLVMYYIEENRVDRVAKNEGFTEAINEARKYIKIGLTLKYS